MKHIFVFICLLAAACSGPGGGSDGPVGPRPGEDNPSAEATLRTEPRRAEFEALYGIFEGVMPVTVLREGEYLPDTLYIIETDDPRGVLTAPPSVDFGLNDTKAVVQVSYSLRLDTGEDYAATLRLPGTDAVVDFSFRNASYYTELGTASYRWPAGRRTVKVFSHSAGGNTEYLLTAEDFRRTFTVDAAGVAVMNAAPAACEGYAAVADASSFTDVPPARPAWSVGGVADGNGTFVLAAVYSATDGSRLLHHDTVTLLSPDDDWEAPVDAIFTDGWLAGVVSMEARPPLVPADNPWEVEYRRSRSHPGVLRLCNIYRGNSPLAEINAGPALSYIIVDATEPDNVTIAPQNSGFANTDLFAVPFMIGGTGTLTTAGNGTRTITIPRPLHNGYGTWGDTWATLHPTVITL